MARLLFLIATALPAQDVFSSVRIQANVPGAPFLVDGVTYTAPVSFLWVQGSKHTLAAVPPALEFRNPVEYVFQTWADSTGLWNANSPQVTVTAHPLLTQYTVAYLVYNRFEVAFAEPGSGRIEIGNSSYSGGAVEYFTSGADITLRAFPSSGWIFTGWGTETPPFGPTGRASTFIQFKMTGPMIVRPQFARARTARLRTNPAGLQVYVDGTPVQTPIDQDWAHLATYRLSAPSPQTDGENRKWLFDRWSFGGGQNSAYTVNDHGDFTLTANFLRARTAIFETQPAGLRLSIDGRENWPVYIFDWAEGSAKIVAAPLEQLDSTGRKWTFKEWSAGGPASQTVAVTGDLRWKAIYESQPRLTVESDPSGLLVEIDGSPCVTPCRIDRPQGSLIAIKPAASIALSEGSRLDLTATPETSISLTADRTVRLSYVRRYRLSTTVSPAEGGSIRTTPETDGYFDANTWATAGVTSNPGFRLKRWDSDPRVFMSEPRALTATMVRVPWSSGARNAAGPEAVSPGSRVAIRGLHLAPDSRVAESHSPLPQTLGGVVVLWQDRMLPLVSVTPEEIQAVLPWDTPEGPLTLVVKRTGQPDLAVAAMVAPLAPGLFENVRDNGDGATTLLATGIGRYDRTPLDGFAAIGLAYALEPVVVLADDEAVAPEYVTASTTQAGIATIRVRLPDGVRRIRLRVGEVLSNVVELATGER
ncbi:MAG: hypothetical protein SFV18_13540 [Bryobacteraceae bacterium]|nr:hypothetical protein [Bryobacteraceae bacterium]